MELKELSLIELRNLAKEKGLKNIQKLKKDELITTLEALANSTKSAVETNSVRPESSEVINNDNADNNNSPEIRENRIRSYK